MSASFYRHQNLSATSTASSGSRRLSVNNPFRQSNLGSYRDSRYSSSTPTINEISERHTMSPDAFQTWVSKNQELESLSDKEDKLFDEDDFVQPDIFISPSRPNYTQRSGSDSSVVVRSIHATVSRTVDPRNQQSGNSTMSNYTNNPFADALVPPVADVQPTPRRTLSSSPTNQQAQQPRSYRSVPPPTNRPSRTMLPPPSYEEAAGPEAARSPYRDEKEGSRRSHGEHRSHRHRSHSDSEHRSGRHHSGEHHSSSRSGEKSSSRHHHHSSRSGRSKSEKKSKEVPRPKNLDTIDKLDVTGFFGGGFHHDGPFEACTPHRNKNNKAAPVMAFPADGPNSSIKGTSQPIKEQLIDYAFGVPNEDDLYQQSKQNPVANVREIYTNPNRSEVSGVRGLKEDISVYQFDSAAKAEPIHGQTTLGLGSSTFIDGAPAPKAAIIEEANNNSLARKKSIVHRVKSLRRKN